MAWSSTTTTTTMKTKKMPISIRTRAQSYFVVVVEGADDAGSDYWQREQPRPPSPTDGSDARRPLQPRRPPLLLPISSDDANEDGSTLGPPGRRRCPAPRIWTLM